MRQLSRVQYLSLANIILVGTLVAVVVLAGLGPIWSGAFAVAFGASSILVWLSLQAKE